MSNIKSLGWGANQLSGSFGNYFGDDDDEISILFPFEGFEVSSMDHFNLYGSFADPLAINSSSAAHASSIAKKSKNHNGIIKKQTNII